jgi:hypothetical protein
VSQRGGGGCVCQRCVAQRAHALCSDAARGNRILLPLATTAIWCTPLNGHSWAVIPRHAACACTSLIQPGRVWAERRKSPGSHLEAPAVMAPNAKKVNALAYFFVGNDKIKRTSPGALPLFRHPFDMSSRGAFEGRWSVCARCGCDPRGVSTVNHAVPLPQNLALVRHLMFLNKQCWPALCCC